MQALRAAVCSAVHWRRVLQRALGYTSQAAKEAAVSRLWDCAVLENTRAPEVCSSAPECDMSDRDTEKTCLCLPSV